MNYGYTDKSKNWKEERKTNLAFALSKGLNIPIGNNTNDGSSPYIEVEGAYGGVRIRRITHLSDKEHDKLIRKADKIHDKVMA